jgi:hypothetical protein
MPPRDAKKRERLLPDPSKMVPPVKKLDLYTAFNISFIHVYRVARPIGKEPP